MHIKYRKGWILSYKNYKNIEYLQGYFTGSESFSKNTKDKGFVGPKYYLKDIKD